MVSKFLKFIDLGSVNISFSFQNFCNERCHNHQSDSQLLQNKSSCLMFLKIVVFNLSRYFCLTKIIGLS